MRQRITFVQDPAKEFNQSKLRVKNKSLLIDKLEASREDVLTFSLAEAPAILQRIFSTCHEFHLRWISSTQYLSVAPYASILPPGLHVFVTPQSGTTDPPVCVALATLFGNDIRCKSHGASFIDLQTSGQRFTSSSATQYYQLLPSLAEFWSFFENEFCKVRSSICLDQSNPKEYIDYIDLDFDAVSATVAVKLFWSKSPASSGWSLTVDGKGADVEVGVLQNEKPTSAEEISLGGFLTVVGKDEKPSSTLFSFPARHHPILPDSFWFYTEAIRPTGLHPSVRISFPFVPQKPGRSCGLHAYLTIPSHLFVDRYQFIDSLFLASKNIKRIRYLRGETDLEAPLWAIDKWGSSMLVEIQSPNSGRKGPWNVEVPLHLRYLEPKAESGGISSVDLPWPSIFWACVAEDGTKMASSPFDRVNIGIDSLFGPKTMFYHVSPQPKSDTRLLVEEVKVPVLDIDHGKWIDAGTATVAFVGFLVTLLSLYQAFSMSHLFRMNGKGKKN